MIILTILILMALMLIFCVVLGVSALGGAAILVFGDVIVCIIFIVLLIKWILNRRRR